MKKLWLVFIVGIFMIGVVSAADVNLALPEYGGVVGELVSVSGTASGAIVNTDNGNYTDYWQRAHHRCTSSTTQCQTVAHFTTQINLSRASTLRKVNYWIDFYHLSTGFPHGDDDSVSCSIEQDGVWTEINTSTTSPTLIQGNWDNVTAIKLYLYAHTECKGLGYGYTYCSDAIATLNEFEAWGEASTLCTPDPIETTCSGLCGAQTDNCGNSVDCGAIPVITFFKTFDNGGKDLGRSVDQTSDGRYIVTGTSLGKGVLLVKFDSNGDYLWNKTFQTYSSYSSSNYFSNTGFSVKQTSDNGYIMTGTRNDGNQDSFLIKTDSNGNLIWDKTLDRGCQDEGNSVLQASDGGYIAAGFSRICDSTPNQDAWLVKRDSNGENGWAKTFNANLCGGACGIDVDGIEEIHQTSDGGYIMVGRTDTSIKFDTFVIGGLWLIKVNSAGDKQWEKFFYTDLEESSGQSVQQTSDNGYIILGYDDGKTELTRTDSNGNIIWDKTFDVRVGISLDQTSDGGYIMVGTVRTAAEDDISLAKADSSGNLLWNKTFDYCGRDDSSYEVQQTPDGGYIIVGNTAGEKYMDRDVLLIKTDSNGDAPSPVCPTASLENCTDGIQNQLETGVDCGGPCPACSTVRWEDMDGNPITTSALGKMVRMVKTGVASGDFEIFEQDGDRGGDNDEKIHVGDDNITGVNEGSNLVGVWEITQDDFDKGEPDAGVEMADGHIEAYFKVNSEESYNLNISDVGGDDQMVVTLDSPNCGENFTIRDLTDIVINASDPDDNITGNVSIDGEVTHFSNGVITIPHTWINAGNIQVELYAENSKGHRIRKITSVMVIDDDSNVPRDYVAACIDNPADFSDITSSKVFFNASSSRGLKCDAHVSTPDDCETMGVKDLYFSWRFSDGLINFNHEGTNILSYMFYKNFATAGHNWAVLDVEFM